MKKYHFLLFSLLISIIASGQTGITSKNKMINTDRIFYIKRTLGNYLPVYFSISDTQPTMAVYQPHISMSYGSPSGMHAMLSLESNEAYGESGMTAVFGIMNEDTFNATIKADTAKGEFIRIQARDEHGRCKYKFTPWGIDFNNHPHGGRWFMSSEPGVTGNVLQYIQGDTAKFQMFTYQNSDSTTIYSTKFPAMGQTAFCTDCIPIDKTKGGVVVTYNGHFWRKQW